MQSWAWLWALLGLRGAKVVTTWQCCHVNGAVNAAVTMRMTLWCRRTDSSSATIVVILILFSRCCQHSGLHLKFTIYLYHIWNNFYEPFSGGWVVQWKVPCGGGILYHIWLTNVIVSHMKNIWLMFTVGRKIVHLKMIQYRMLFYLFSIWLEEYLYIKKIGRNKEYIERKALIN